MSFLKVKKKHKTNQENKVLCYNLRVTVQPLCTHSMVSLLTRSKVSRCARSNSSWYRSILSAFSQSLTVATDDKSVGVGLSSVWEQLLKCRGNVKNDNIRVHENIIGCTSPAARICLAQVFAGGCCLTELALPWGMKDAWWADPKKTGGSRSLAGPLDQSASTEASESGGQGGSCGGQGGDTGPPLPSLPAMRSRLEAQVGQMVWGVLCNCLT